MWLSSIFKGEKTIHFICQRWWFHFYIDPVIFSFLRNNTPIIITILCWDYNFSLCLSFLLSKQTYSITYTLNIKVKRVLEFHLPPQMLSMLANETIYLYSDLLLLGMCYGYQWDIMYLTFEHDFVWAIPLTCRRWWPRRQVLASLSSWVMVMLSRYPWDDPWFEVKIMWCEYEINL